MQQGAKYSVATVITQSYGSMLSFKIDFFFGIPSVILPMPIANGFVRKRTQRCEILFYAINF